MEDRRFIKPRAGLTVRQPVPPGDPLPPHGKGVVWSSFWQRRLEDGDVEPTTEKAVLDAEKKAAAPADKGGDL